MAGRHNHGSLRFVVLTMVIMMFMPGCGQSGSEQGTDFRATGTDAYVYGSTLVMAYQYMYNSAVNPGSGQYMAPFNTIHNIPRIAKPEDGIFVPNLDTPYSWLWMDLRAEPMVLSVPAVDPPRYYAVQLSDLNMFNFGYIGSRTTGTEPGDYLVAGPDWEGDASPGIRQVFRSGSQFAMAIFRTQLFNSEGDLSNVVAIQDDYQVQPLSAYLGMNPPAPAPDPDFPAFSGKIGDPSFDNFFEYMEFVMDCSPAGPEEIGIRQELGKIGVGEYKTFDYDELSAEEQADVQAGLQDGVAKLADYVQRGGIKVANGWQLEDLFGDRAFFNGDWLKRAAGAKAAGFGNSAAEAVYPSTINLYDQAGQVLEPLDGSKHDYTLTFEKDHFPPVDAFWSVTMYGETTESLVANPIDRYVINSPMLPELKLNDDGSLTIYIQKDLPSEDLVSNWLPAPDGPIYMILRMYSPKQEPPSILPPGEGTWNPPTVVIAD